MAKTSNRRGTGAQGHHNEMQSVTIVVELLPKWGKWGKWGKRRFESHNHNSVIIPLNAGNINDFIQ